MVRGPHNEVWLIDPTSTPGNALFGHGWATRRAVPSPSIGDKQSVSLHVKLPFSPALSLYVSFEVFSAWFDCFCMSATVSAIESNEPACSRWLKFRFLPVRLKWNAFHNMGRQGEVTPQSGWKANDLPQKITAKVLQSPMKEHHWVAESKGGAGRKGKESGEEKFPHIVACSPLLISFVSLKSIDFASHPS